MAGGQPAGPLSGPSVSTGPVEPALCTAGSAGQRPLVPMRQRAVEEGSSWPGGLGHVRPAKGARGGGARGTGEALGGDPQASHDCPRHPLALPAGPAPPDTVGYTAWSSEWRQSPLRKADGPPQLRGLMGRRDGGHTLGLLSRPPAQIRGRQSELGQASGPPGGPHLLLPQVRGLGRPEISQGSGKAELSADDGCLPSAPPPASIWTLHIPSSVRGRERTFSHTWGSHCRAHPADLGSRKPFPASPPPSWSPSASSENNPGAARAEPGGSWGQDWRPLPEGYRGSKQSWPPPTPPTPARLCSSTPRRAQSEGQPPGQWQEAPWPTSAAALLGGPRARASPPGQRQEAPRASPERCLCLPGF